MLGLCWEVLSVFCENGVGFWKVTLMFEEFRWTTNSITFKQKQHQQKHRFVFPNITHKWALRLRHPSTTEEQNINTHTHTSKKSIKQTSVVVFEILDFGVRFWILRWDFGCWVISEFEVGIWASTITPFLGFRVVTKVVQVSSWLKLCRCLKVVCVLVPR